VNQVDLYFPAIQVYPKRLYCPEFPEILELPKVLRDRGDHWCQMVLVFQKLQDYLERQPVQMHLELLEFQPDLKDPVIPLLLLLRLRQPAQDNRQHLEYQDSPLVQPVP